MKGCMWLVLALLSAVPSIPVYAQDSSAVDLQSNCAHWSRLHLDKNSQFKGDAKDMYATGICYGYFAGLIEGMDNTGGWQSSDKTVSTFQIKRKSIDSTWDVIRAFHNYVAANPLEKGKPAWSVLQNVLTTNGLATFVPQQTQMQASALSSECRVGANNVQVQFDADNNLKTIDTVTLFALQNKLDKCLETKGMTDSDMALLLGADTSLTSVLMSRAMAVLGRHELLGELRAERSMVSRQKTTSAVPRVAPVDH